MTLELIEIDAAILRKFLEAQGLPRTHLAQTLKVTTKTIQRWLNGTVRRLKPDTLGALAKALGVSPSALCTSPVVVAKRPIDRSLEELCSDHFIQRVRAANDWESYRRILKTYSGRGLGTQQELILYKHIGFASLFIGKLRSAKSNLEKALEIAQALRSFDEQIFILNWLAIRSELVGHLLPALDYFEESRKLLAKTDNPLCKSDYHFKLGRVLHFLENHKDAAHHLRKSILLDRKMNSTNQVMISVKYFHLGETYLRARDFKNARISFIRNLKSSERAGWVRGQSYSHFCMGIIRILHGESYNEVRSQLGKAKRLRDVSQFHRLDSRVEKFELFYCLANGFIPEAKSLVKRRLAMTRLSRLQFSSAVLDGLFLAKLHPEEFKMRPSFIEKAADLFAKNNLHKSLTLLEYLNSQERISLQHVFDLYHF